MALPTRLPASPKYAVVRCREAMRNPLTRIWVENSIRGRVAGMACLSQTAHPSVAMIGLSSFRIVSGRDRNETFNHSPSIGGNSFVRNVRLRDNGGRDHLRTASKCMHGLWAIPCQVLQGIEYGSLQTNVRVHRLHNTPNLSRDGGMRICAEGGEKKVRLRPKPLPARARARTPSPASCHRAAPRRSGR